MTVYRSGLTASDAFQKLLAVDKLLRNWDDMNPYPGASAHPTRKRIVALWQRHHAQVYQPRFIQGDGFWCDLGEERIGAPVYGQKSAKRD